MQLSESTGTRLDAASSQCSTSAAHGKISCAEPVNGEISRLGSVKLTKNKEGAFTQQTWFSRLLQRSQEADPVLRHHRWDTSVTYKSFISAASWLRHRQFPISSLQIKDPCLRKKTHVCHLLHSHWFLHFIKLAHECKSEKLSPNSSVRKSNDCILGSGTLCSRVATCRLLDVHVQRYTVLHSLIDCLEKVCLL